MHADSEVRNLVHTNSLEVPFMLNEMTNDHIKIKMACPAQKI